MARENLQGITIHCVLPMDRAAIPSAPKLQKALLEAKNKKEAIEAFKVFASACGGFSNAPKTVFDKIRKLTA